MKKYNKIWDKVRTDIKKILIAKLHDKTFLKTKTKSYGYEARDEEVCKVNSNLTCLPVI